LDVLADTEVAGTPLKERVLHHGSGGQSDVGWGMGRTFAVFLPAFP
jgi:hypothetical protein